MLVYLETEEIKQHKYDVVRCSDQKFYRNINGTQLNRQKNPLTKNIIRQFIREVAYKDRYVGAPWIVSSKLVDKYDLLKEVPAKYLVAMNKNMKKVQLQREREREKLENRNNEKYKQHKEKVVYPIEDSELPVDPRLNKFPIPSFCMTDFSPEQFSTLLFTWHFLWYFQKPLKLLSFHVEDYEDALLAEGFSPLLLNIYCSLLSILLLKHSIQQALNEHNWDNTIKVYLKARAQETFYETDVPKELKKLEDFKSLSSSQRLLLIKMFIDDAVCSEPIRGFIQSAMDTCCEATKERRVERASYRKSCAERERMRKASLADARNTASTSEESNDEDFKDTKNFTDSLLATTNKAPRRAVLQYKKMLEVEELRIQQALEGKKREETLKKAKRRREEEDFKKSLEEEKEDQEREYKYRELLLKLGGYRCKPLGADRRRSLYYLFDSRIYVEDVEGKWGYYALPSELEQLLGYLNTKGKRELKFHQTLMENFSVLQTCIKERQEEFEGDNQIRHSARIQKKYLKETSK